MYDFIYINTSSFPTTSSLRLSCCGKTTWAHQVWDQAREQNASCQISCSDDIRRVSIEEYNLGRIMFERPDLRNKAIYAMFGAIVKERELDPRL